MKGSLHKAINTSLHINTLQLTVCCYKLEKGDKINGAIDWQRAIDVAVPDVNVAEFYHNCSAPQLKYCFNGLKLLFKMEAWEINIITTNFDKLTNNTTCSSDFLNKFLALKIFSREDVDDLSLPGDTPSIKSSKFYRKIVTREHGFTKLMEILKETKQSGARSILKTGITKEKLSDLDEIRSVSFDKDAVLGKGSNGTVVFKGKFGDRPVAVKRVNSDNEEEKMIVKEIENLKKCDRQENIVRYYGTNVVENFILVVLELCDMTLKDWLPKKPINISPVELLRQVTVGLEWLHSQRIVHRDLKPENILLTSGLIRAKISDFGLSRKISEERNYVSSFGGGTQGWVAPEILQADEEENFVKYKFTFASDVFSLGCVYYYVLSDGKHPFGGRYKRTGNIIDGKHKIDAQSIGADNVQIITIMISNEPQSRPSCSALLSYPIFLKTTEEIKKSIEKQNTNQAATESRSQMLENVTLNAKQLPLTHMISPKPVSPPVKRKPEGLEHAIQGAVTSITQTKSGADKTKSSNHFKGLIEAFNKSSKIEELSTNTSPQKKLEPETSNPPPSKILRIPQGKTQTSYKSEKNSPETAITVSPGKHSTQVFTITNKLDSSNQGTHSDKVVEITKDWGQLALNIKVDRLFEIVEREDLTTIKIVHENFTQGINIREVVNKVNNTRTFHSTRGYTLLHSAMIYQDEHVVEYLLRQQQFCMVLHETRFNDLISNRLFLETVAKLSGDEFNRKLGVIRLLLNMRPELVNCGNGVLNETLWALSQSKHTRKEHVELLRIFLQHKADANAKSQTGGTPLFFTAYYFGNASIFLDIVKLLMEYQANPNAKDGYGSTFLYLACSYASEENFYYLITYMASIGKAEVLKIANDDGLTILHYLVREKHLQPETLELLVLNGADVNATNKYGNSVFLTAIRFGHTDSFLNKLIEFGANWKIVNNNQNTALHIAAHYQNLSAVKLLISLGSDVNAKSNEGRTPLHAVVQSSFIIIDTVAIITELINHGANVKMKDAEGKLPLDWLTTSTTRGEPQQIDQIRELLINASKLGI